MASEDDNGAGGGQDGLGRSVWAAAIFAAGIGAALGGKALLDSRKKDASAAGGTSEHGNDDAQSQQDLPSVLRRAALDVAFAATNQAAERLDRPAATAGQK
jgi:hypothetical protein